MDSALPPITIVVEGAGKDKAETVASPSGNEGQEDPNESSVGIGGAEQALKKLVAPATAIHVARKLINNEISTVELRTGAREYEQKLQFGMRVAGIGMSVGASIVGGIMTGNPLVAVAGIVLTAANTAIDVAQRYREIAIKENREDISLGLARIRAGYVNPVASGGRRGE